MTTIHSEVKKSAFFFAAFLAFVISPALTSAEDPVKNSPIETARQISTKLTSTLKTSLANVMKSQGPVEATKFCNLQAGPLRDSVQSSLPDGITVSRVTLRPRNPDNKALEADAEVLRSFPDVKPENGQEVEKFVSQHDGWAYYRALYVGEPCLSCHGKKENLAPELLNFLKEKYPSDQALGYLTGELRGAVKVSHFGSKSLPSQ